MKIEDEIQQRNFNSELQKATINLLFTANWLSNEQKDFFKKFDVTPQQFNVLRILRGQHPKTVSTSLIKERMLDKNSDVSRIVDRLTLKKLVDKNICPSDRRLVDVKISKKGLDLLAKMDEPIEQLDQNLNISEAEAKQLNTLLNKIRS